MSRQSRELKKQQERAKKYGCDGRCYWSTGMCPSVEICVRIIERVKARESPR